MSKGKKIIEKVVYSLLLEYPESSFLSVQYAYSLEEALYLAKEEYQELQDRISGGTSIRHNFAPKLSLFTSKSVTDLIYKKNESEELFKHYDKLQEKKKLIKDKKNKRTKSDKVILKKNNNELMKEIIKKKDRELLEKNIKILSKSERLYIESKIK